MTDTDTSTTSPPHPREDREGRPRFTPGPWRWWTSNSWRRLKRTDRGIQQNVLEPYTMSDGHPDVSVSAADMALISAAPDLHKAVRLQEEAEDAHANCDECEGEGVPECCPKCFPLFDDARVARRLALAKAEANG